jgi:protein-S-isoprenylcysteine O-methyltransferase Ste14
MKKRHKRGLEREAPHSHLIQAAIPLIFTSIWIIDTIWLEFSTFLNQYIPICIRLSLFILFVIFALILGISSHNLLFHEKDPSETLITDGVFGHLRNPLYLAILLFYTAFIWLSLSLLCMGILLIAIIVYNWMVNKEEQILEDLFGEKYRKYKQNVPKWIPRIKKYRAK